MAFLPTPRSITRVTQAAHGFVAGDVLYNADGTWTKAQANALATSVPVGVVESASTDSFVLVTNGEIKLTGLTAGVAYYLSPTTAGTTTTTKPTTAGQFVVPVYRTGTSTRAYVNIETPEPAGVSGTVTSVAVAGNNGIGVSGSPITTSGTITLSLGAITPSSVNGNTITTGTGTLTLSTFTLTVTGTASITGTNTGDQTITLSGDASGSGTGAITVTLATVNANVGTFGTASKTPTFTVNAKGLITAASQQDILIVGSTQLSDYGDPSGVATLDAGGKLPVSQLPDFAVGQVNFRGLWNASTNTPALDNTDTDKPGYYYVVSVAGTVDFGDGDISFEVGDWVINNVTFTDSATESLWQKVDNSDAVMSVFGRIGTVTAQSGDYTAAQVTNTPAGNIAAITVQAAINELDSEKQAGPLTGDVTTVSTSNSATTIALNAVTFAKFQQISTGVLLGRSTAGTGNVEQISIGSNLTLAGGTLSVSTGLVQTTSIKTTTYTVTAADRVIIGNHATTPFTITLIAASSNTGVTLTFKNKNAAVVTIDATSLGQIYSNEAVNTLDLSQGEAVTLISDGSTWLVV